MAVSRPGDPAGGSAAYRSGLALLESGQPAEAERRLRRAMLLAPADPAVHAALATALLNQDRPAEALPYAAQAAAALPSDAGGRYLHGLTLVRLGRFAEAVPELAACLVLDPSIDKAWSHRGDCLRRLGRWGELLALAADRGQDSADFLFELMLPAIDAHDGRSIAALVAAAPPGHPAAAVIAFLDATRSAMAGDWNAAHRGYRAAAERPPPGLFAERMLPPCRLLETSDWAPPATAGVPLPGIEWHAPAPGEGPVVSVACDGRYLALFAPTFARSLAAVAPQARCHIHVVDPDSDSEGVLAALRATPTLRLGSSSETAGSWRGAGYYAAARFIRAPALLDVYGTDIILADVDATVLFDLRQLAGCAGPAAACFRPRFPTAVFPWLSCSAALVVLRAGAAGRAFAGQLADYILDHLDRGRGWFIDQIALHFVGCVRGAGPLTDLQAATRLPHEAFCRPEGDLATKQRLRAAADGL